MKARCLADSFSVVNEFADRDDCRVGHQGTRAGNCGHATIILTARGFGLFRFAMVVLVAVIPCVTYGDVISTMIRRMFIRLRDFDRRIWMHRGVDGRKAVSSQ